MNESTALTVRPDTLPGAQDWATMLQMADVLVRSGLLPAHVKTPQAAVAIIQKGRELGIQPMYALSNIIVIQGKPTANSELMLALVYRDHGDEAIRITRTDKERCEIAYKRRGWKEPQVYAFTAQDAQAAGLNSDTWKKYAPAMLRARCISAVARMAFPDSIGGMYGSDELGNEVVVDGDDVRIVPPPAPPLKPVAGTARPNDGDEPITEAISAQLIATEQTLYALTGEVEHADPQTKREARALYADLTRRIAEAQAAPAGAS